MLGWLGLRTRLVLLVLLALLPVVGLLVYSAQRGFRAALQVANADLQSQVLMLSARQQRTVEMVHELLNGIASSPHMKNPVPGLCGQHLKNLHAEHPEFNNLGLAAADGKLLCNAQDTTGEIDISDRSYFLQVMAGKRFAVAHYEVGRKSGRQGVGFAVPVRNDAGDVSGVAFAVLDLNGLTRAFDDVPPMAGARLTVLDGDGTVVAVSPQTLAWVGRLHPDPIVQQAVKERRQAVLQAADAQGLARVYAMAPVSGGGRDGLFVAVSVPYEQIAATSRDALAVELLALLAVALLGAACAWSMGNRLIVNPAQAILKEANEVAMGNMNARVRLGPLYQGELGEIGSSFNRMAESLQARQRELDAVLGRVDKERGLLDHILNSMNEGVIAADTEGRFLLFNATARKLFTGVPDADTRVDDWRRGHELLALDGKTVYTSSERPLTKAARGISVDNWDVIFRRSDAEDRVLRISTRPLRDIAGRLIGGLTVFNDITELKAAESFAIAQEQVLALIAGGAPLGQSLDAIVRLIEKSSPDSLCSILLLKGQKLYLGAAPSLPDSYNQAIEGLQIGEGVGACGSAAVRNALVVVEDTQVDPLMQDYRELMRAHNLRACWSTPVVSTDGDVVATFAIYRTYPCKPQAADLELIDTATRLAGIALQRARAEEALVSSEGRFRELAENIHDVFYNVDPRTGRLLYISPAYEKIWGRSCESLYADPRSYADAAVIEDQPLLKLARKRNRTGEISDIEYRIISTDGKMRWIRDHSYPVFNSASGVLERVVGTARDVTDSKLAELALASTNRALQMLSRSSIAINRLDEEAALLAEVCRVAVDVGDYRMAWVGYALNDEARSIEPMAHAGYEGGYLSAIRLSWRDDDATGQGPAGQAIRSGQPEHSGDISRAGTQFHWHEAALARGFRSAICLPLLDGPRSFGVLCLYSGEAQHFTAEETRLLQELADNLAFGIVSLRARLERRRSQEAARQAAAKLREQASLLDRAQDAIMVRNLDRTIRFWNKGAERLYGWTAEEVIGKTMDGLMYQDPEVLTAAMAQTVANDGDWTGELVERAKDGSVVCVEARWTVVRDDQGQVNGVLGINSDIGERKRAREEILRLNASLEERVQQRTAQLEFANKQLEAFSYSVSHDLRSPLSAVDGFSDLLERAMAKTEVTPLTERSRHYLTRIRAGVSQMGELIDAMLTLAQVSRSNLRWEPVDLSALATALLDGRREREPERKVRIQVEPGLKGMGDPRLLKQVLDNLLGNAWKFSAKQPLTDITFGHEVNDAGETVYFVRDKGTGFDMAYAEKLFGAFQRLHSLSEFSGTGIGLATVQRIVARHGGRVWAQSSLGQGATFYFTLGETL